MTTRILKLRTPIEWKKEVLRLGKVLVTSATGFRRIEHRGFALDRGYGVLISTICNSVFTLSTRADILELGERGYHDT